MITTKRRRAPRAMNYRTGALSGMGAIAVPVYEDCDPSDSACVARNNTLNAAYNLSVEQDTNKLHLTQCLNLGYPSATCHAQFDPGGIADSTANAGQPVQGYGILQAQTNSQSQGTPASGGRVTFTSSRGGNTLQVGDTWLVSITGATPGKQVTATVGSSTTPMGTTDTAGNFTLAGTARTADVGAWNETWAVGGVPSGGFSFTVQPAMTSEGKQVVSSSGAGSGSGTGAGTGSGTGAGSSSSSSSSSAAVTKFDFSKIPTWAWVAAAAAALFAFGGSGGR